MYVLLQGYIYIGIYVADALGAYKFYNINNKGATSTLKVNSPPASTEMLTYLSNKTNELFVQSISNGDSAGVFHVAEMVLSTLSNPCDIVQCGLYGECSKGFCICRNGYSGTNCSRPPMINGNYSAWLSWTICSASCGGGFSKRKRLCDNPFPSYGGSDCSSLGPAEESRTCNENACSKPIDGGLSEWSPWSPCSNKCPTDGRGGSFVGISTRYRTCTNPAPGGGGKDCSVLGEQNEEVDCNITPCPGPIKICPGGVRNPQTLLPSIECNGHGTCLKDSVNCTLIDWSCQVLI
jgi:hypothetical protein